MPPKRGGYRRSGYTRSSYKGSGSGRYAKKPAYSATRKKYSAKRPAGSWGGRKYTRGRAVIGVKSTIPTTTSSMKTRVEVKQHNFGNMARLLAIDNGLAVEQMVWGATQDLSLAAYAEVAKRIVVPVMGLASTLDTHWGATVWQAAVPPAGDNPGAPADFIEHTLNQSLVDIVEGFGVNQRVGRVLHINAISLMLSATNVGNNPAVATTNTGNATIATVPKFQPITYHIFVVQEYQPTVNGAGVATHLTASQFMNTFYDLTNCPNKEAALIAPKNRYTADAHGRILLRKKIVVDSDNSCISRRFSLRFTKPIEVRYHGALGAASENRVSMYIIPVAPVKNPTVTHQVSANPVEFRTCVTYVPSTLQTAATVYYTDA